jgi:hypothetical protein
LLLSACASKPADEAKAPATPPAAAGGAAGAAAQPQPALSAVPAAADPAAGTDCGALGCRAFPSAAAALDHVLRDSPRVLGIGEAHAQSGGKNSASATLRFTDQLLPRLAPRATDLVIELWVANGSCGKVEQKVQKQQQAVTAPQAATNQAEFMELGHRAKALSIQPHALVPSCEQYRKIAGAGSGDVAEMLTMVRDVTLRDISELLSRRAPDRLIVAYGGSLHNDLIAREGRQDFTFGPALAQLTGDRYVELDLVIPEQIKDSEAWRALPWYPHYSREKAGPHAYLLSWAPRAYALFFPKEPAP